MPLLMTGTEKCFMEKEIANQPRLWRETYDVVLKKKKELIAFLTDIYKIEPLQIILTGAGSSAFIGEILEQSFSKISTLTKAVPTTDLVTHPQSFFDGV